MNDLPINWYMSKTIWFAVLSALAGVLGIAFHWHVSDADMQELATDLALLGTVAGSLMAIYGRLKASAPISGTQAAQQIQPKA